MQTNPLDQTKKMEKKPPQKMIKLWNEKETKTRFYAKYELTFFYYILNKNQENNKKKLLYTIYTDIIHRTKKLIK